MEKKSFRIQKIETILSYAYIEAETWEDAEEIASFHTSMDCDIFEFASSSTDVEWDGTIEITDKDGAVRYEH